MPFVDSAVSGQASSVAVQTLSLTSNNPDNIIVVLAYAEQTAQPSITGVSATGLTFTRQNRSNSSTSGNLELWWALAATPGTFDITISYAAAFDDASAVAAAISGVDTSAPWDTATSASQHSGGNSNFAPSYTVTTASDGGMVLFGIGTAGGAGLGDPGLPAGFLGLPNSYNRGGNNYADQRLGVKAFSSALSSVTYTAASLDASSNAAESTFDVLKAAAPVAGQADPPALAAVATKIDGVGTSFTIDLAGVSEGDVVCLLAYAEKSGAQPAITSVTSTGLTFALRNRAHGSTIGDLELWWATAAAAGDYTIAFTYAAAIDDGSFTAFSVSGTDPAGPWDTNAAASQTISNTVTPAFTVSTDASSSLLIAAGGSASNGQSAGNGPSGFLSLPGGQNGGGSLYANNVLAVKSVTSPQSSATYTWQDAMSLGNGGTEALFDALMAAPAAPSGPVDPTITSKQGQKASGSAEVSIDAPGGTSQAQKDTSLMLIANASHVSGAASTSQGESSSGLTDLRTEWQLRHRAHIEPSYVSNASFPAHDLAEGQHVVIAVYSHQWFAAPSSVTDTAGNVYTQAITDTQAHTSDNTVGVSLWVGLNLKAKTGNVIRIDWPSGVGYIYATAYYVQSPLRTKAGITVSAKGDPAANPLSTANVSTEGTGFMVFAEASQSPDSSPAVTPAFTLFNRDVQLPSTDYANMGGYGLDGYRINQSPLVDTPISFSAQYQYRRAFAVVEIADAGMQGGGSEAQGSSGVAAQTDIVDSAHTFQSQGVTSGSAAASDLWPVISQSAISNYSNTVGNPVVMPPHDVQQGSHLIVGVQFFDDTTTAHDPITISDSGGGTWTLLTDIVDIAYNSGGTSNDRVHWKYWLSTNRSADSNNVVTVQSTGSIASVAEVQFKSPYLPVLDATASYSNRDYFANVTTVSASITTTSTAGGLLLLGQESYYGGDMGGIFSGGLETTTMLGDGYSTWGYEPLNSPVTNKAFSYYSHGGYGGNPTSPAQSPRAISLLALKPTDGLAGGGEQGQSASGNAAVEGQIISDSSAATEQGQKLVANVVVSTDLAGGTASGSQYVHGNLTAVAAGGVMTVTVQSVTAVAATESRATGSTAQGQLIDANVAQVARMAVEGSQGQTTQINAVVAVLVDVGGMQGQSASGVLAPGVAVDGLTGEAQSTSAEGGTAIAATNDTAQGQQAAAAVGLSISFDVVTGQIEVTSGNVRAEADQSVVMGQSQAVEGVLGTASIAASATAQGQEAGAAGGTAADSAGETAQGQRMGQGLSELKIVFDVTVVTSQAQATTGAMGVPYVPQGGDLVGRMVSLHPALTGDVFTRPRD